MEEVERFISIDQARNAAVAWLETRNVVFGPYRKVEIGRLGVLAGHEVGVSSAVKPFWRLRLDFDPNKGPHFNAEFGEGAKREKKAFLFPGDEALMRRLALGRRPR